MSNGIAGVTLHFPSPNVSPLSSWLNLTLFYLIGGWEAMGEMGRM